MQIRILFAGEGVTIPYVGAGLSFAGFKIWTGPPFQGFTTATNQALLGLCVVETPVVDIGDLGTEREGKFRNLHARVIFVKIEPTVFFRDGGLATVTLRLKDSANGQLLDDAIQFVAENCRGVAATAGPVEFAAELLQLPQTEWDPNGSVIP